MSTPPSEAADPTHDTPEEPEGTTSSRHLGVLLAVGIVAVIGVIAAVALVVNLATGPKTVKYVIPAGTGERIDAGEVIDLMPTELKLKVGDTLILENQDDRNYFVGPFTVRANETVQETFRVAGAYRGACSLNPEAEIKILVS